MAAAGSGDGGGGGSFKERTFADFSIDPLSLDAEGNDKVLDLIEENNTLTHEASPLHTSEPVAASRLSRCSSVRSLKMLQSLLAEGPNVTVVNCSLAHEEDKYCLQAEGHALPTD